MILITQLFISSIKPYIPQHILKTNTNYIIKMASILNIIELHVFFALNILHLLQVFCFPTTLLRSKVSITNITILNKHNFTSTTRKNLQQSMSTNEVYNQFFQESLYFANFSNVALIFTWFIWTNNLITYTLTEHIDYKDHVKFFRNSTSKIV